MKRLIVNADDFGLTDGINRAIIEGHEAGGITSATLMANAPRSAEAAALSKSHSGLGVGCHIVLVDGHPVSESGQVRSLLAPSRNGSSGFRNSLAGFAQAALRGKIIPAEIELEACSQIRKLCAEEVTVTHFDTHKHTHILPAVLRPLLRAAREMGVTALRNPFEPEWAAGLRGRGGTPGKWIRPLEIAVLRRFLPEFRRLAQDHGMRFPDGTIGVALTGSLDHDSFSRLLHAIPDGTWELVSHPGHMDDQLLSIRTRLRESRQTELQLLTSGSAKEIMRQQQIHLIGFRDL